MEYLQYQTSNTHQHLIQVVLNLIINGIPSIQAYVRITGIFTKEVLNLIINGIPSIRKYGNAF